MKEYKTRRRGNSEFRNKQNRALRAKRLENIGKKRESQRWVSNKCKESNPDHIRELNKQAFAKSKKNNPHYVQDVNKIAENRKRSLISGFNPCDHHLCLPATKRLS